MSFLRSPLLSSKLKSSDGQIIVEYMLLMVIAITIALMLVKSLASRGDEKGLLIKKMCEIHRVIGADVSDAPESPGKNLPKGCP